MKKTIFLMTLLCLVFASCKEDESTQTGMPVGTEKAYYTLQNEVGATVRLGMKTIKPAETDLEIPVKFTGAEEGVDFTASANAFHVKKGDSQAFITLTRKKVSASKTLMATLQPTNGVKVGMLKYSEVYFVGANIYSFDDTKAQLALSNAFAVSIRTDKGDRFSFNTETKLDVELDKELSTAVEGTHFKFANDEKKIVFKPGDNTGTIALDFLKLEKGKDKIVLRLPATDNLSVGKNSMMTIQIVGPANFNGTWAFKTVSNAKWLKDNMGANAEVLVDGTPENDLITFKGDNDAYIFTPQLKGKLKNYFTAPGKATYMGTRVEMMQEYGGWPMPKAQLSVLRIDNVNLSMDEKDQNIKQARVGFRLVKSKDTGEEMLEMTIYDYKPVENTIKMDWGSTWKETYEMMEYSAVEGEPVMLSCPLRVLFTKVSKAKP